MKKILAMAAAIIAGAVAVPAQQQVLKNAERAMKDGKSPAEVVSIITPAFTNPETQGLAQTYFIPGKAMFGEFDQLYGLKQFNKLPANGAITMGNDLIAGYNYFMKALPLDSVPNEKGKIKTKYSKEIINTLTGHIGDYNEAALAYWDVQDYAGAYNAWQCLLEMAQNPTFIEHIPAGFRNDTVIGEIAFNQGIAAWQADSLAKALKSFELAKSKCYNKKNLYDYSLAVAQTMGDMDKAYEIALEAQPIYGKEDSQYIGFIINKYLQNEQFDEAFALIDEAIANDPDNAQYYLVKGILYDNQGKKPEAKATFMKAVELDPTNSQALYNYGRMLCEEAYTISDQAPTSPAENEKFFLEKIVPLFQEAAEYLERAWDADNENIDALRYLENVYYNLKDEAKMKDVEQRKSL